MPWYDGLLQQGYVPTGQTPKAVVTPGGDPGYYQTDRLGNAARGLDEFIAQQKKDQEQQLDRMKKKSDMYHTLREAGYNPDRAFRAVEAGQMPDVAPDISLDEQKKTLDLKKTQKDIEKTGSDIIKSAADIKKTNADTKNVEAETQKRQAETDRIKNPVMTFPAQKIKGQILQKIVDGVPLSVGEQRIYDETIKRPENDPYGVKASLKGDRDRAAIEKAQAETEKISTQTEQIKNPAQKITDQILAKISSGQTLTSGEQKIYDDVIKKQQQMSDLEMIMSRKEGTDQSSKANYVPMIKPDGTKTRVHPEDVNAAIAKGYRKQ